MTRAIETDALVIGAGPVGLFQVFQLGLQGVACHLVDALPHVGGQCIELYADKPIYDIPGVPECSGRELVERLQQQIAPFSPTLHLGHTIAELTALPDGRWSVVSDQGRHWQARTVFIAAGVGAFVPRSLPLEGLTPHMGRQVHHAQAPLPPLQGQHLLVCGDTDSAVQTCLAAVGQAASVTLMHRRDQFAAAPEWLAALAKARAQGQVRFVAGQPSALLGDAQRLTGLRFLAPDGQDTDLPCDQLVMALGLSPKLGPVAQWGLAMERKQLVVQTDTFATDAPGIYAVGDINTYPGKKKLILCGFHEATLAAFGAIARLQPDQKTLLQYTTTSTLLQQRLGRR